MSEKPCTTTLAPLRESTTALLTTFRRRGGAVSTPVSVALDAGRAYFYLPEDLLASLVSELALEPCNRTEANVIVHLPVGIPQPFPEPTAGPVVTALDLFDAGDSRSRHAGRRLWSRELAARRFDGT